MPIKYRCVDALKYKPMKDERYDTIYFDIWPTVSPDNYDEMKMLHRRWAKRLKRDNPNCFMDSWRRNDCRKLMLEEKTHFYRW
jgi:hypothetical protein